MKITKKNGNLSVYDDEKVTRSILRANSEVPEETITEAEAAAIADEVTAAERECSGVEDLFLDVNVGNCQALFETSAR